MGVSALVLLSRVLPRSRSARPDRGSIICERVLCSVPRWPLHKRADVLCRVPPSRAARSVGPPRLDVAPPRGWLLSSAFLASVVRVHGKGGLGQQKANPNVDLGSVTDPRRGSRRLAAGVRPSTQCEEGGHGTTHPPSHATSCPAQHIRLLMQRPRALHNAYAFLCNGRWGFLQNTNAMPARTTHRTRWS